MEMIVERPCTLDIHKAEVTACVRVPDGEGGRWQEVHEFKTTVAGLLVLRDWLKAHGVTQVAMEATWVYWKPIWHVLEDDFELMLVNARHVKQVPGRKTDVSDAAWLCQLLEAGLLRASFVPPKPIRELRSLTRYRKAQVQERQREANRLHKALEDTGVKLDCVASDILEGAVELLCSFAGVQRRSAENILAEIGVDMSVFPSERHLASWAGQCPGNHESAGKRRSGRTRKGSKWLNTALKDAAMAAVPTNDSYLQAQYRRLKPRLGHGRALGAVKHSIICAAWHMLSTGELYPSVSSWATRRLVWRSGSRRPK